MLLSFSKKFIFIHIDKSAGTSVKAALSKYCWYPHETMYSSFLKKIGVRQYSEEFYDHIRAYELKHYLDEETFNNFFKFAFVRNPWDWMLSSYTYYLKNPKMHPHVYFKDQIKTFKDFILWQTGNPYIYHTQSEYLFDHEGKQLVDYIGRFESVEEDFKHIIAKLGINEVLPHKNISKEKGYAEQYTDETRELVHKYYQRDIEHFGYNF
ncbi:MAG: sulfotransferase family 2 domain-containing protein [Bacteroidia bacterium]